MIAGLVPDGFMVPFPTDDYVHQSFALHIVDNSIYTGGTEPDGQGWVKVPGNAAVVVEAANEPQRAFTDAATALRSYSNGVTRVQMITWPGAKPATALGYVNDISAGTRFSPQEGFYESDVMHDGALAHQYMNRQCWFNATGRSAVPGSRTCASPQDAPAGARALTTTALSSPVKYVVRDWQVNTLAARGQAGDCKSREVATGGVHFSTAADATLVTNLSPNPGAQVSTTAAVGGDGSALTVRVCNTGNTPVRWELPPQIVLTQLP